MSKKKQAIIIGSIVICVLVAALLVLLFLPKEDTIDQIQSEINEDMTTLIDENADDLVNLKITNESGEYEIEKLDDGTWGIAEFNGLPQVTSTFTEVKNRVSSLSATKTVIENAQDVEQYGLKDPEVKFEADFGDGKTYTISLGLETTDGLYCYGQIEGDPNVYAISAGAKDVLSKSKFDFLDTSVIPQYENQSEDTSPNISYLSIERPDLDKPIVLEVPPEDISFTTTDPLVMTSPVEIMIDIMALQDQFYNAFGLTADSVVAARPDEAELAEYGFDAPSSTLTITYGPDEEKKTIKAMTGKALDADGNVIEGDKTPYYYYMMTQDSELVYLVPTTYITWDTMQAKDLLSTMVTLPYIGDVESVDVTLDGEKHTLQVFQEQEETEDSDQPRTIFSFTLDGKEVDSTESKQFYQVLLASSVRDVNEQEVTQEPDMIIVYHMLDGKEDTLEYYLLDDMTLIISFNGSPAFVGRSGYIEKVKKEFTNLQEGKDVITDW